MKNLLGILIVNNNDLQNCLFVLNSIDRLGLINIYVCVLDNNCVPSERIQSYIARFGFPLMYSESEEKLTRSVSFNNLMSQARLAGCEMMWLCVRSQPLQKSVVLKASRLLKSKNRGMIGIVDENDGSGFGSQRFGSRWQAFIPLGLNIRGENVDWVESADLLIKLETFLKVGRLDPKFYSGMEIIDYCLRIRKIGKTIGLLLAGKNSSRIPIRRGWLFYYFKARNPFLLLLKHTKGVTKYFLFSLMLLVYSFLSIKVLTDTFDFKLTAGYWVGFRDGVLLVIRNRFYQVPQ